MHKIEVLILKIVFGMDQSINNNYNSVNLIRQQMKTAQYTEFGNPLQVISLIDIQSNKLEDDEVRIKLEFSPINPADLFVIMGSYPLRPKFPAIPGSEGVGRIIEIGSDVNRLKEGDIVLLPFQQGIGTWRDEMVTKAKFVEALPKTNLPSLEQLSMASVNPPSALYMLENFVELEKGDWIIQNAANGAVGRCIIGIAKKKGLKTINVVRREELGDELKNLGGDHVLIDGPDLKKQLSKLTDVGKIKLGFDAVAGVSTHQLSQCIAENGILVNYGAMSMKKCELGASQTIFRSIKLIGFWYHKWTNTTSKEQLIDLVKRATETVINQDIIMNVHNTYTLDNIYVAIKTALREKLNGKVLIKGNSEFSY